MATIRETILEYPSIEDMEGFLKKVVFVKRGINPEAVGIEEKKPYSYLTDEEKINIIANLTSKQKAIIRRDFLIANFKNAYGNNAIASLLLDFAQKHMPDLLADIKNGHNEVYEKRHQRIEEKKAVLLVQEQAKQEAEQSDKQQSEVGMQTEEQPQEEDIAA